MPDEREVGSRVKNGIIGVIRGTGEIAQAAVLTVSETAQVTVKAAGTTGGAVAGLAVAAVKGAIEAVGDVGGQASETAATSVETAVDSAARVGAKMGAVTKAAVIGAIRGTKDVGGGATRGHPRDSRRRGAYCVRGWS